MILCGLGIYIFCIIQYFMVELIAQEKPKSLLINFKDFKSADQKSLNIRIIYGMLLFHRGKLIRFVVNNLPA